jgi:hypothetical protein
MAPQDRSYSQIPSSAPSLPFWPAPLQVPCVLQVPMLISWSDAYSFFFFFWTEQLLWPLLPEGMPMTLCSDFQAVGLFQVISWFLLQTPKEADCVTVPDSNDCLFQHQNVQPRPPAFSFQESACAWSSLSHSSFSRSSGEGGKQKDAHKTLGETRRAEKAEGTQGTQLFESQVPTGA